MGLLERLSLKDGLLLWEALGEDPRAFPLGKAETRERILRRIRGERTDKTSARNPRNKRTDCPPPLRAGEDKAHTKTTIQADRLSEANPRNKRTKRPAYPDPAGALAQELGGWRAGLLFRARREQNPLIQKLAHGHKESLLELLNLAEGLPLLRRIPTTLAWLPDFAKELERLGDAEVQRVLLEVRKRGAENPLSYAARVLVSRGVQKKEEVWETIGQF